MPRVGLEPTRPYGRDILSVVRIPIPPPGPVGRSLDRADYTIDIIPGQCAVLPPEASRERPGSFVR